MDVDGDLACLYGIDMRLTYLHERKHKVINLLFCWFILRFRPWFSWIKVVALTLVRQLITSKPVFNVVEYLTDHSCAGSFIYDVEKPVKK